MKTKIKKIFTLLFITFISVGGANGQSLLKNGVSANFGMGFSSSSHTIHMFNFGYQREISKGLYVNLGFTDIQGSQSYKSIFGEIPQTNEHGEFGEASRINESDKESLFGRLIQVSSWSLGLKKYIQLGQKLHMAGSLAVLTNNISKIEIEGLIYNNDGAVNYDDARPAYGTYNKISGRVGFEILYNLKDGVNLTSKIEYLSLESIVALSLGTAVYF